MNNWIYNIHIILPVLIVRRHVITTGVIDKISHWCSTTFVNIRIVQSATTHKKLQIVIPKPCNIDIDWQPYLELWVSLGVGRFPGWAYHNYGRLTAIDSKSITQNAAWSVHVYLLWKYWRSSACWQERSKKTVGCSFEYGSCAQVRKRLIFVSAMQRKRQINFRRFSSYFG